MDIFNYFSLDMFNLRITIVYLYLFNNFFLAIFSLLTVLFFMFKNYYLSLSNLFFKKYILIIMAVLCLIHIINMMLYMYYYNLNYMLFNSSQFGNTIDYSCVYGSVMYNISIDFFSLVLVFLAFIVGFISLIVLDIRIQDKYINYYLSFFLFMFIVHCFVSCTNFLLCFLFYEFLLLPSFFFVYFLSTYRRSIIASLYFVVWTQIGSLFVFSGIIYMYISTNSVLFSELYAYVFTASEKTFLYLIFFIGFGIKIPIWPFHYWLTKTHVEAPSGFSIYLSGFLVKSALYGFYKFTFMLSYGILTYLYVAVIIFGIIDSSLKMWGQTDLKKLVAYATIQEMNLIFLVFTWGDSNGILYGILFCFTHAFLSAIMFFLVDCIYRRFHTRSIIELHGIFHLCPVLAVSIFFMLVLFSGLPGTMKFISEFYVYLSLFEATPILCFFTMFFVNFIGLVGFSKAWFNSIFGLNLKYFNIIPLDFSKKDLYIYGFSVFFLLLGNFSLYLVL